MCSFFLLFQMCRQRLLCSRYLSRMCCRCRRHPLPVRNCPDRRCCLYRCRMLCPQRNPEVLLRHVFPRSPCLLRRKLFLQRNPRFRELRSAESGLYRFRPFPDAGQTRPHRVPASCGPFRRRYLADCLRPQPSSLYNHDFCRTRVQPPQKLLRQ